MQVGAGELQDCKNWCDFSFFLNCASEREVCPKPSRPFLTMPLRLGTVCHEQINFIMGWILHQNTSLQHC